MIALIGEDKCMQIDQNMLDIMTPFHGLGKINRILSLEKNKLGLKITPFNYDNIKRSIGGRSDGGKWKAERQQ